MSYMKYLQWNIQQFTLIYINTYLWLGNKGFSGNCKEVLNIAEVLGHDGKATALLASCSGYKSLQKAKSKV